MDHPRLYRSVESRARRLLRFMVRVAIPASAATLILTACIPRQGSIDDAPDPCIETHEHGCVLEPEFEGLVDETAVKYAQESSYGNQWGLEAIHADRAYAHLELQFGPDTAPGEGVTVGILDTGIDGAAPQFSDKNVIERFLQGATDEVGDEFSHGTAVASILAGEALPDFDHEAQGVAWGADLVVFAIPLGDPPEFYVPIEIEELPETAQDFAEIFAEITNWRYGSESIDFLNLSLGVSGIIESYSEEDLREHFAPALTAFAQEGAEDRIVLVWAAGNANGLPCEAPIPQCVDGVVEASSVDLLSGLAARIEELEENTVAVVAIRPDDGLISDFSNRCGIASDSCLAAPGERIRVAYSGPDADGNPVRGVTDGDGTSFAAPVVTGSLALMKQYFRSQLSNPDLLSRLLETADRSGPYADAAIYGRGLMDLGAATSPVGDPVVALGARVEGPGAVLHETGLQLGPAFGDAFASSFAHREIAAFDTLGAPFWYDLGSLAAAAATPSLTARLRDFQRASASQPHGSPANAISIPILESPRKSGGALPALYLARFGPSSAARSSHFAITGRSLVATVPVAANLTATALTTEGLDRQEPASGAALTWRAPEALLGLRAGWIGERRTMLGTVPEGAFGDVGANAVFAGIEADADLSQWRIGGSAEVGTVNAQVRNGMFEEITPVATSTFTMHATRPTPHGGVFQVSLSQPLRAEDGHARLMLPSGRTTTGDVVRSGVNVGVEPSGRQVDLSLQWRRPLEIGELRLGATLSREPRHYKDADSELILLSGWRLSF